MEMPPCSRDDAAVAVAAGGDQPRGEIVWYRSTTGGVALRARVHHEAKNWLVLTDCSNAFNTVKRTAVLAEATTCVPALAPFVAKRYGERSAPVFFQMDSGERRKIDCSSGVQRRDAMGPTLFWMRRLPVLK